MGIKVEGGILTMTRAYKVTQDATVYWHYIATADVSGDIEEFKTKDAAMWWLMMDNEIYQGRMRRTGSYQL